MAETEAKKVYELAKELGIDSISLLDKLRVLGIRVKNHMSELTSQEVDSARHALKKKADGEKVAKKTASKTRKKEATSFQVVTPEPITQEKKQSLPSSGEGSKQKAKKFLKSL